MDLKFVSGRAVTFDTTSYTTSQLVLTNDYDLGSVEARPWSATAAGADGDNYYGMTMATRDEIFLPFILIASSASDRDDFIKLVKAAFNPYDGVGTLTVTHANGDQRAIFCTVTKEPVLLTGTSRGLTYQIVQITLKAWYPFWKDPVLKSQTLASFTGGMSFPIVAPMTFGTTNTSVTITNNGTVPTPIIVTFTGEVVDPCITLYNAKYSSGVHLSATMTVGAGEYLRINTAQGLHSVEHIVGTSNTNVFQYLDTDSEFIWLEPGTNTLTFTQTSAGAGAACAVEYWEQYLGAL